MSRMDSFISLLQVTFKYQPSSIANVCPITVAIAAPFTPMAGKPKQPKPAKVKREWPTNLVAAARAVFTSLGDDALKIIMGDCKPMEEVDSGILAELLMAISDIPRDDEPSAVVDDGQMDMLEAQA